MANSPKSQLILRRPRGKSLGQRQMLPLALLRHCKDRQIRSTSVLTVNQRDETVVSLDSLVIFKHS
eukprot:6203067-Pleurochrysis_carterae.AAC.1